MNRSRYSTRTVGNGGTGISLRFYMNTQIILSELEIQKYSQLWCIIISLRVLKSIADKGDQKWKQPKNSNMRK